MGRQLCRGIRGGAEKLLIQLSEVDMMMTINQESLEKLFEEAKVNPRLRMNLDMRTSAEDGSQRMLNAMLPGTEVAIHRHPMSNENVILIKGRLDEVLYEEVTQADGKVTLKESERIHLCPEEGVYGCQVPQGVWHTVEVLEPSVIYEGKDGKYGEDGSETFDSMQEGGGMMEDVVSRLREFVEDEARSGSMDFGCITPLYIYRMWGDTVSMEDIEAGLQELRKQGLLP